MRYKTRISYVTPSQADTSKSSIIQTSLMKKFIVSIISMNLNNPKAKKKV